jgi:hypothetical protein
MKAKALLATLSFALAGTVFAGEAEFSPGEIIHPAPLLNYSPSVYTGVRLGNTHMQLDGLLLDGVLPRDQRKDRSFGEKILGLPVVNLMTRKSPPPAPTYSGSSYFGWKDESRQPWTVVAARAGGFGSFSTVPADGGPTPGLLSLSF